jgi:hypothetical protein
MVNQRGFFALPLSEEGLGAGSFSASLCDSGAS